jgi:hypothetical protein
MGLGHNAYRSKETMWDTLPFPRLLIVESVLGVRGVEATTRIVPFERTTAVERPPKGRPRRVCGGEKKKECERI